MDLKEIKPFDEPRYSWWGINEDRHLLYGVYKHGVGSYDEIKTDPQLCFYGRVTDDVEEASIVKYSMD